MGQLKYEQGEDASGNVIEHDAGAFREPFQAVDRPGFEDVEQAEEKKSEDSVGPVRWADDQGNELAGYFVDNHLAGIFSAGIAGYDGRGGYADEDCDDDRDEGYERKMSGMNNLRCGDPEEYGCGAAPSAGPWLQQTSAEEGRDSPSP